MFSRSLWVAGFFYLASFVVFWARFWVFFVPKIPGLEESDKRQVRHFIRLAPPLLAAVFYWGVFNASIDLDTKDSAYSITLSKIEHARPIFVLRTFDKGLLVRNVEGDRIEFYKWSDIHEFNRSLGSRESYFCQWTGRWCLPKSRPGTGTTEPPFPTPTPPDTKANGK